MNKKGMEMWELILLIIAAVILLFMIIWIAVLGNDLSNMFKMVGGLFR